MRTRIGLLLIVGAGSLATAAPAAATTFCVPTFHSACANDGVNVQQASLQTALLTAGDDGSADRIVIAAGTVSDVDSYTLDSGDNDDLEIVGAGPGATAITTSQTGNPFVLNLAGARAVTMRDLTVRVPASFNDNQGGAIQAQGATFENVDIESRNVRSDGAQSMIGGGTFRDGRVYGSMGGSIDTGFSGNGAETGVLTIERTSIEDASWGVSSDDPEVSVFVRRTRIADPLAYGVRISDGAFASVQNTIIEADTGTPVVAESNDAGTVIVNLRHLTIVGTGIGASDPAIRTTVQSAAGNGPVNLVANDTIIAGYPDPLTCEAPSAANVGDASLTTRYSYFFHSANVSGDCSVPTIDTVDAFDPAIGPPQFAGASDYHLPAGSPAIDTGDPLTATLPTEDYDGAPRPVDGNADGTPRRDMGAYEHQPPVPNPDPDPQNPDPQDPGAQDPDPPDQPPGDTGDKRAPSISKLRARGLSASDGGRVRLKLDEAAAIELTFKRARSSKGQRPAPVRLRFTGVAGRNRLRIKRGKLDAGAYRLKAAATDAAGNRSTPARARVEVLP